jgi:hypothetical protein
MSCNSQIRHILTKDFIVSDHLVTSIFPTHSHEFLNCRRAFSIFISSVLNKPGYHIVTSGPTINNCSSLLNPFSAFHHSFLIFKLFFSTLLLKLIHLLHTLNYIINSFIKEIFSCILHVLFKAHNFFSICSRSISLHQRKFLFFSRKVIPFFISFS